MESRCPIGHTENLSFETVFERLKNDDFECRHDSCSKKLSYEIDHVFWKRYFRSPRIVEL